LGCCFRCRASEEARDSCHFLRHTINITLDGGVGGWGGVGWGGIITSLARPHIRDATVLYALLHVIHMLRYCRFSCASTLTPIYPTLASLALPHIRHSTLL